jgi:copper resistance protein C
MKKVISLIVLFFLLPVVASAHTGLESSNPGNAEVVVQPLSEIVLTFETKIEEGSTLEVKNHDGQTVESNVAVNENQLIGTFAKELENNHYTVLWNIIGEDGHLINGEYSFEVNIPEATKSEEEPVAEDQDTTTDESSEKVEDNNTAVDPATDEKESSVLPIVLSVILGVIVIGSIIWAMRRKK